MSNVPSLNELIDKFQYRLSSQEFQEHSQACIDYFRMVASGELKPMLRDNNAVMAAQCVSVIFEHVQHRMKRHEIFRQHGFRVEGDPEEPHDIAKDAEESTKLTSEDLAFTINCTAVSPSADPGTKPIKANLPSGPIIYKAVMARSAQLKREGSADSPSATEDSEQCQK